MVESHFSKNERRWVFLPDLVTKGYELSNNDLIGLSLPSSFPAGSIIGLKGNVGQAAYSATKGGLIGFSRSLAKEVARKKIRVNVVAPGQ